MEIASWGLNKMSWIIEIPCQMLSLLSVQTVAYVFSRRSKFSVHTQIYIAIFDSIGVDEWMRHSTFLVRRMHKDQIPSSFFSSLLNAETLWDYHLLHERGSGCLEVWSREPREHFLSGTQGDNSLMKRARNFPIPQFPQIVLSSLLRFHQGWMNTDHKIRSLPAAYFSIMLSEGK